MVIFRPGMCYSVATMKPCRLIAVVATALLVLPASAVLAGEGCEAMKAAGCCAEDAAAGGTTATAEVPPMSASSNARPSVEPAPCCEAGPASTTEPVEAAAPPPAPAPGEADVVEASVVPTGLGSFGPIGLGALAALAVSTPLFLKNRSLRE